MTAPGLPVWPAARCYEHERDEAGPGFRRCFECGHLYRTAEELQRAWTDNAPPNMRNDPVPPTTEIFFCPFCLHDF